MINAEHYISHKRITRTGGHYEIRQAQEYIMEQDENHFTGYNINRSLFIDKTFDIVLTLKHLPQDFMVPGALHLRHRLSPVYK